MCPERAPPPARRGEHHQPLQARERAPPGPRRRRHEPPTALPRAAASPRAISRARKPPGHLGPVPCRPWQQPRHPAAAALSKGPRRHLHRSRRGLCRPLLRRRRAEGREERVLWQRDLGFPPSRQGGRRGGRGRTLLPALRAIPSTSCTGQQQAVAPRCSIIARHCSRPAASRSTALLHYCLTGTLLCSVLTSHHHYSLHRTPPWRWCSGFHHSRNEMAGVGAGTGALGSVIGKLATLLGDEYTMLKRVRKDIAFLERELRRMQILVNMLADMEQLDELANDWKGSMRDLSYDMEECIDRFMLRLGDSDAKPKFVKRAVCGFKALFARHGIATQIKELKARVQEEGERRKRLNLDNYAPTATVAIDPRLAAFHGVPRDLVAIDGPRDQVISWLTQGGLELKVVAIVGCGGLGKTTLAMEAYRKAGEQFHCRASVSVSRTFDPKKLLKDLLSQIDEAAWSKCKSEMREWDKDQLIREIQRILTGKRYFFVIDDVWKEQHWAFFKAVFRDSCNGSRLIVTTRITKVGRSCCSNSHDQLYQMPHLTAVDSRRLLLKRIFHSDHSCPTQLKDVSDRIIRKCGGLPLAIITIASLLANKSENTVEWERLEDSIGNGLSYESDDDGNGMRHILLLSYWDLPHHLKTCLLYLCIYPEDWHIPCEELKWKWIAEGFIATKRGNLYQEADNCFNELVNRSMIQFVDVTDNFDDFKGYCQIHDMVLDLIISLSDTENFATILNGVCNYLPSKIRRLSLQSSGLEQKGAMHAMTRSKLHVRSLNVFGETMEIPPLVDFRSLRVFDMTRGCSSWENNHIRNIGSLYQLRYLEIHKPSITELPEDIGNLQNLETLDLRGTSVEKLPPTIAQLTKLVRLFVDRDCVFSGDMFGSMRALEEVSNITKVDNPEKFLEGLGHLTKLRKLSMCYLWHKDFDRYGGRLRSIVNELGKYNLRYLYTTEELGRLLFSDPCCTFPHLQHLKLQGMMSSLHSSCGLASLTNIIKLQIRVDTLYEEELIILMNMPSLAYLHLGLVMSPSPVTVSSNGFRLLEVFHYSIKRNQGTGIKFAEGAMPALRRLRLSWRADSVLLEESDSADMGIEHLSSLAHLLVETDCEGATVDEVEALEDSILKAVALHPNRHTFQLGFYRYKQYQVFKDDNERNRTRRSSTPVL